MEKITTILKDGKHTLKLFGKEYEVILANPKAVKEKAKKDTVE